jgi:hypothetical protein
MVKADDALSEKEGSIREQVGWGGSRQHKWRVQGKRAVIHVEPGAYEFVTTLAKLCRRPGNDLCSQIFAAGLEKLTGFTLKQLAYRDFTAPLNSTLPKGKKAFTHEEVLAVANLFTLVVPEEPQDPEFQ